MQNPLAFGDDHHMGHHHSVQSPSADHRDVTLTQNLLLKLSFPPTLTKQINIYWNIKRSDSDVLL